MKPLSFSKILLSLLLVPLMWSCQQQVDVAKQWRQQNEEAFASYEENPEWEKVSLPGLENYVMMKWSTHGTGTDYPIETSRVKIHQEIHRIVGSNTFLGGNFDQEIPITVTLNRNESEQVIIGLRIALQNMVVGDEAQVVIPWYLAYGEVQQGNITPYTALRYVLRLDEIIPEEA